MMHPRVILTRKTYILIAIMSLVLVTALLFDYYAYNKEREDISIDIGQKINREVATNLDSILDIIGQVTHRLADQVKAHEYTPDQLIELIVTESQDFDMILGITVAYQPFQFNDSIPLFALYFDKRQGSIIDIAEVYDYTDSTLNTAIWYTNVVAQGKPIWSEPYFAQGAQMIVSDYGVPIYKNVNGEDKVIGTVTLTLALETLSFLMKSLTEGTAGYAMLFSPTGVVISHPNSKNILSMTLDDFGRANNILAETQKVLNESEGHIEYLSRYTNTESYFFYNTLESSGWKVIVVLAINDLLGHPFEQGNKIVNICLAISFLVMIWLAVLIRINENTTNKLWVLSRIFSILSVFNIAVIWYLNVNLGYSDNRNDSIVILSETELYRYVLTENQRLMQMGYDPYFTISTGIFVEGMEFKDSYNVSVRGKIWQKWPIGLDEEFPPDFQFIQQSPFWGTTKTLVSVKRNDELYQNLYLWDFKTTLRLPLRYLKYPFDSRDVNIEIAYPDLQSNIMLIPDLDGYKVLNPSAFPGIKKSIYFPQSTMTSTYFSFELIDFQTQFGNEAYKGDDEYPIMEFNIQLKRRFLNAFVTNIIPILVVASMIFLIFYSNSKRKDENTGVSMMGVVQSCAGFFFVLLIAHIDLRKRIASPDITYLETFYFTMYVMIGLLAINIVAFTKAKDSKFLHYQDNLLVKLAYWPLLLGSWLTITLMRFYN